MTLVNKDGVVSHSAGQPGLIRNLYPNADGVCTQYKLAQFSLRSVAQPQLWWTSGVSPSSVPDTLMQQVVSESRPYLFHGSACVSPRTSESALASNINNGCPYGLPLRHLHMLSLRERELAQGIQNGIPSYFQATAELPGVFLATFSPPPAEFWRKKHQPLHPNDYLEAFVYYAWGERQERFLINVASADTAFFDPVKLGQMLYSRTLIDMKLAA
jgi:hypothetical protein